MVIIENGRVVRYDRLVKEPVAMEGGMIAAVPEKGSPEYADAEIVDAKNAYVTPGFVDIHNHAGGAYWAYENPAGAARHHLSSGTTTVIQTLYHDIGHQGIMAGAERIQKAMETQEPGNIGGIHLEGPYLSRKYGASSKTALVPSPEHYHAYIREFGAIIRQWTFSPELDGTDAFIDAVVSAGITLSIGHSEASPERVYEVVQKGVTICTHITNATGCSITPTRYAGTREVTFDEAVMLCDDIMCELINDSEGVHVRPLMTRLIAKTIGIGRLIGITDACTGGDDNDSDVNILNGELFGSKLTMLRAAKNFIKNTRLSITETFRVCATNPARAVGLTDRGEIQIGKRADILILDDKFNLQAVYLQGQKQ